MSVLDTAKVRSSVRAYTEQAVEEEKLQKILETAHVAPTAANMQPVRLVVVRSREGLSAVSESANIYGAPVAVVVCADNSGYPHWPAVRLRLVPSAVEPGRRRVRRHLQKQRAIGG